MNIKDWPYFSATELACKCGKCPHTAPMDAAFMDKLIKIRTELGHPMVISSAYRCPDYNDKVSHSGRSGPHTTGHAVDIICSHRRADLILLLAYKYGMTGKGISQSGNVSTRFLHLDDLPEVQGRPRPHIWSY